MPDFVIPFDRLPERFAESVRHPPQVPAKARPAATIVLLRDGASGPEVLLLRRARHAGFVPGAYVFPGGRVDAADAEQDIVAHLDGLDAGGAAERLELSGGDPPALAYYLAALREAFEETGILVGRGIDGSEPATAAEDPAVDALRNELMGDRLGFAEALERLRCRLDGGAVEYLAHWITPEPEPRRYDTRFFAAKVRPGATSVVDTREMTDAVWLTPDTAMRRYHEGSLPMVFPTIRTLQDLRAFVSVDAILGDLRGRRIPTIMPRLVVTPTGIGMDVDG
jgi:recombination protein RecT